MPTRLQVITGKHSEGGTRVSRRPMYCGAGQFWRRQKRLPQTFDQRYHQQPQSSSTQPSFSLPLTATTIQMSNKSQFYLTECINAASKSSMLFTLGSVIVKGGKVISSGFNHQRPRYDEAFPRTADKPVSMHAEMHAIFNVSGGKAPSFKQQVQSNFVQCIKRPPPPHEGRSRPLEHFPEIAEEKSSLKYPATYTFRQDATAQRNRTIRGE